MLHHTESALPFPDSLISRAQCLGGAIDSGSPLVRDLQGLLADLPLEASAPARLIVRQVFMRVFGRFAQALDAARDAASIRAFVAWSATDAFSDQWRDDLFHLVGLWRAAQTPTRDDSTTVGAADVRMQRAVETIDRRYAEPRLALRDVALAANLSLCQAARMLKRQTGRGFVGHVHARRVAAGRRYLTETTLSIKEIADRIGYASASEFGRHFKGSCGVTPRAYRHAQNSTSNDKNARMIGLV
jgi:AraC-like DNA-binding protein